MQAARLQKLGDGMADRESGFSMMEILVTLVVASILIGVAIPSFQSLMVSSHLTATTNTMVFSLQSARSEAIKRGVPAGVCTSDSPLDEGAGCTPGSGFVTGWIAYVDNDRNGTRSAGEDIIMAVEDRGNGFTITPDAQFASQVYFDDTGGSANAAEVPLAGNINISYGDGTEQRLIQVSANGRISTTTP